MKITRIDKAGMDLITKWEGLKLSPYLCSAKVPTIGYGSTRYENGQRVQMTDKAITKERAIELFKNTLIQFERDVDAFTTDSVNQNQFNALVSFAYNLGSTALRNSTLLKKVNTNPNDKTIANEFNKWVNAGGRRLQGLVNRRADEVKMYFK
jgi:lysozyme